MPDRRRHRGPHPDDERLFATSALPELCGAVSDLSWLLTRGYAEKSTLKLVGDRFNLSERQRTAVMRCSCSDFALARRRKHEVTPEQVRGQPLLVDGYNVLTTIEAGLAGGCLIEGRDGCYRDMASMHGTFHKVHETVPAVTLLGQATADLGASACVIYLDRPVSNSGRLRALIEETAAEAGWPWRVELVDSPDRALAGADACVATADSVILDRCDRWFNLARRVVTTSIPQAWVVSLRPRSG